MITFLLKILMISISTTLVSMKNPVKLSMMLLSMSGMIFFMMSLVTGEIWFPTLFFLLFMGGILMMFMILSSILPNEKSNKVKISLTMIMIISLVSLSMPKFQETGTTFKQMKSLIESSQSLSVMILLMMVYFFSSISILCKEELPMRSVLCCG